MNQHAAGAAMTWPEFWALFHRRWGSDHESPEYVKAEWGKMQLFLEKVEKELREARSAIRSAEPMMFHASPGCVACRWKELPVVKAAMSGRGA